MSETFTHFIYISDSFVGDSIIKDNLANKTPCDLKRIPFMNLESMLNYLYDYVFTNKKFAISPAYLYLTDTEKVLKLIPKNYLIVGFYHLNPLVNNKFSVNGSRGNTQLHRPVNDDGSVNNYIVVCNRFVDKQLDKAVFDIEYNDDNVIYVNRIVDDSDFIYNKYITDLENYANNLKGSIIKFYGTQSHKSITLYTYLETGIRPPSVSEMRILSQIDINTFKSLGKHHEIRTFADYLIYKYNGNYLNAI